MTRGTLSTDLNPDMLASASSIYSVENQAPQQRAESKARRRTRLADQNSEIENGPTVVSKAVQQETVEDETVQHKVDRLA